MSGKNFSVRNFSLRNFSEDAGAVPASIGAAGFRHIGRFSRDELEENTEEAAYTVATTEHLPEKPPSRKMRKRLAVIAKQDRALNDDEEEALILLLAA